MAADKSRWKKKTAIESTALLALEAAWQDWASADGIPKRTRFDPAHFPLILPWVILGELADKPNDTRPYDVFFRYIGTEFAHYFQAQAITRMHLSEVGPPYAERWFAVTDAVRKARAPCYFSGTPLGTGFEYISLEMLALPFAGEDGEVGFVLCAFARTEELLL
ncbi:MAG: PAS domain-containing protein [Rhodospirillaceae bacterium]|nr:PAS domain-containing protein [Rhodospirillaceae bacterium]